MHQARCASSVSGSLVGSSVNKLSVIGWEMDNIDNMKQYFDAVLDTPPLWPLDTLRQIVSTHQDLAHRNGVTKDDEPVYVGTLAVTQATTVVR